MTKLRLVASNDIPASSSVSRRFLEEVGATPLPQAARAPDRTLKDPVPPAYRRHAGEVDGYDRLRVEVSGDDDERDKAMRQLLRCRRAMIEGIGPEL